MSARADRPHKHGMHPIVVALAVMVVWGGTPLLTKLAAAEIEPFLVGVLRTVLAGSVALPVALAMRLRMPSDRRSAALLAFSGFAAFVAFPLAFSVGQSRTSALHGALVLAMLPVFTSLFGTLVERRRPSARWAVGCAVALLSEAFVIAWGSRSDAAGSSLAGDLIVLASSAVCAMGYVAGARLSQRGYPALSTTLWGAAWAAVALVPALLWSLASSGPVEAGATAWGAVMVLAIVTSVLAYVAWYWALAHGGISRVSAVQFTQPLFGVALAALVLGERPGPVVAAAGVGILFGAWLVLRAGTR